MSSIEFSTGLLLPDMLHTTPPASLTPHKVPVAQKTLCETGSHKCKGIAGPTQKQPSRNVQHVSVTCHICVQSDTKMPAGCVITHKSAEMRSCRRAIEGDQSSPALPVRAERVRSITWVAATMNRMALFMKDVRLDRLPWSDRLCKDAQNVLVILKSRVHA